MVFKNSSVPRWEFSSRLSRVFLMIFVISFWGIIPSPSFAQGMLLEDFSTMRTNGEGDPLWSPYTGGYSFGPNQTGGISNGVYQLNVPANERPYFQFWPYPYNIQGKTFAKDYIKSGTWDPNANRLSFWMKTTASGIVRRSDGGPIAEIGTYVKGWDNQPSNAGDHYYHYLAYNAYPNRWILVVLNRQPQHEVGQDPYTNWPEDPTMGTIGVHYFDGLTRFYFTDEYQSAAIWGNNTYCFDNFEFSTVPGEPDTLVSSMTATYTGSRYEVTWAGPKNSVVTYNVRYSTSSMKSSGFTSGTDGGAAQNPGTAYVGTFWASQNMPESSTGMHVAIQPTGQSNFTEVFVPNFAGSGSTGDSTPPAAPTGLRMR